MKKRIFAVLLALCLALALVPASALAADANGFTINQNGVLTQYTGTSTDVVIPEGVTEIGSEAFRGLPLTSVTCPSSLLTIGFAAFSGCRTLTNVTLSGSLVEIKNSAFQDCIGLKNIIIYDGVKRIGDQTFSGCISLKSVTIPASVTTIDTYAFSGDISLEDVYYGGSEMQWNSISFPRGVNGNGNGNLFAAKLHLNTPMPDPPTPTTTPDPTPTTDPTPTPVPVPTPAPDDPKPGTDPVPSTGVKVTGVTLSQSTLTMAVGDTATLTATVAPDNADNTAVSWVSNNNSIATIDSNGLVIAISPGLAVMRATTADGGFTTQCRVTVEEKKTETPDPGAGSGTATPSNVHFPRANVYHQGQFTDVSANQWYTQSVADAFELGLMKGSSTTTFNVNGNVTVAEAITMASRIHCIYTNGSDTIVPQSGAAWYQAYLDYAYRNKIIGDAYYNSDVTQIATRAQFAEIFVNSLPEEGLNPINNIPDGKIPDVPMSAAYAAAVYRLYRAGILSGGDATGTFSPSSFISRVEAAAIVSRMAEANSRKAFTL